jgi:hypothetical protein
LILTVPLPSDWEFNTPLRIREKIGTLSIGTHAEVGVSRKNAFWIGGLVGATLIFLSIFMVDQSWRRDSISEGLRPGWSRGAIRAAYVGSQLQEIDKTRASLIISYDLENDTDSDYRLANGPSVLILSRMKSGGSLSQEQPVRLRYPVFLPARQQARLALEITQPFAWPAKEDLAGLDKIREFVRRQLENVGEFVLFDEASHGQVELPGAWGGLQDMSKEVD